MKEQLCAASVQADSLLLSCVRRQRERGIAHVEETWSSGLLPLTYLHQEREVRGIRYRMYTDLPARHADTLSCITIFRS